MTKTIKNEIVIENEDTKVNKLKIFGNTDISNANNLVNGVLADKETMRFLTKKVFNGLKEELIKPALLEGFAKNFTLQDFLGGNVYAIPFSGSYALVQSIRYSRRIAHQNGLVSISEPTFTRDEKNNIETCSVTVKRITNGQVGEFVGYVYYDEYAQNTLIWKTKPHTMIAKCAEQSALRKAFPEYLSDAYVEEEFRAEDKKKTIREQVANIDCEDITDYEDLPTITVK
jgi:hypothetical protein